MKESMNKIKKRKVKYFSSSRVEKCYKEKQANPINMLNGIKNSQLEVNKSKMMKILESVILKQDLIKFKNKGNIERQTDREIQKCSSSFVHLVNCLKCS